mmetsp:Transcript_25803/g.79278  ORF Transcript_25803/g.79278 Transcript_25803/m.79278 type:complete len:204 (-) Transcript_25803:271-882(-)
MHSGRGPLSQVTHDLLVASGGRSGRCPLGVGARFAQGAHDRQVAESCGEHQGCGAVHASRAHVGLGVAEQPHDRHVAVSRRRQERRAAVVSSHVLLGADLAQELADVHVAFVRRNHQGRVSISQGWLVLVGADRAQVVHDPHVPLMCRGDQRSAAALGSFIPVDAVLAELPHNAHVTPASSDHQRRSTVYLAHKPALLAQLFE